MNPNNRITTCIYIATRLADLVVVLVSIVLFTSIAMSIDKVILDYEITNFFFSDTDGQSEGCSKQKLNLKETENVK